MVSVAPDGDSPRPMCWSHHEIGAVADESDRDPNRTRLMAVKSMLEKFVALFENDPRCARTCENRSISIVLRHSVADCTQVVPPSSDTSKNKAPSDAVPITGR